MDEGAKAFNVLDEIDVVRRQVSAQTATDIESNASHALSKWDRAYVLACKILHSGQREDWDRRFQNRPDWQWVVSQIEQEL